ncbi:hypothetical protein CTI12_AA628030 [Artemisia annua]|nr:hypothetical protein CTI12_AA628030 [Artemisia annua]
MFYNELEIVSRFHHENIIPYIGYCDEGGKQILIYEHAINGSLRDHLQDPDKLRCIPWEQRLKICLGAARGLRCLHSGLWDENKFAVHRHVRSEYILLDENMEAKISEFGLSIFVPRNKPQVSDYNICGVKDIPGTKPFIQKNNIRELPDSDIIDDFKASMDPIYKQSYIVNTEVDVYSFGCVMFEILSGLNTVSQRTRINSGKPDLIRLVHHHYGDNEMDKLVDPNIRDQIDGRSLRTFAETAYRCLSYNIKERPSMNRIIKKIEEALYFQNHKATISTTAIPSHQYQKLEDLFIPLKEINLATCEFSKTSQIGDGGFGVVYKGRLSEHWKNHEVAIKRLDKTGQQGKTEFRNELELISRFHHQNIIPFVGYCDEGGILRPESDVYSFGVVMFEMLSGMLAWYRRKIGDVKPRPLINLVRRYFDYGKELLIDPQIKDQIDNSSFQTFIETAYQCISFNSKERPTMEMIADKIEEALDFQVSRS